MSKIFNKYLIFFFFILSGAASLSYQMLWLRKAMTYFGVITPVTSSVLCVFMLGIAVGTHVAGIITRRIAPRYLLKLYALIELGIGLYALLVPKLFARGYIALLDAHSVDSFHYLLSSWIAITLTLLPVCILIGSTLPVLLKYLECFDNKAGHFGFLYTANLVGAGIGCILPLGLIEIYGMQTTLLITAALNGIVALGAFIFSLQPPPEKAATPLNSVNSVTTAKLNTGFKIILFITGFMALGSETVWIHAFTYVTSSTVYAFAMILLVYLYFNGTGSYLYIERPAAKWLSYYSPMFIPASALLAIIGTSLPVMHKIGVVAIFFIGAVCFFLGYFLPRIIDESCGNDTQQIAKAYNYNLAGCIVGPLVTTYLLFPHCGIKGTLLIYAALLLLIPFIMHRGIEYRIKSVTLFLLIFCPALLLPSIEEWLGQYGVVYRDWVGYEVVADSGRNKVLFVNGIGMTTLTTDSKNMAHIAMLNRPNSRSALIICFGMGSSVRSMTTWPQLDSITAVELSNGVIRSFGYSFSDAEKVLSDPRLHIVVDDGRRFVTRSSDKYDIILLDPPPPINAAASGLLYSDEFIALLKAHLTPNGILQHWVPRTSDSYTNSFDTHVMLESIKRHFKYIKMYHSFDNFGYHITASDSPLPDLTASDYAKGLPPASAENAKEWNKKMTMQAIGEQSLKPIKESEILIPGNENLYISDDMLYNEFEFLRLHKYYSPIKQ